MIKSALVQVASNAGFVLEEQEKNLEAWFLIGNRNLLCVMLNNENIIIFKREKNGESC